MKTMILVILTAAITSKEMKYPPSGFTHEPISSPVSS